MRAAATIAALLLLLSGHGASAEEPALSVPAPKRFRITLPDGWSEVPHLTQSNADNVAKDSWFGGLKFAADAEAFSGHDQGGGALVVYWVNALETADRPEVLIRAELDRVENSWRHAPGKNESLSWQPKIADSIVDAELVYRDLDVDTITIKRILIYLGENQHLHLIGVECSLFADKRAAVVRRECERVLASLEVTETERSPLPTLPDSVAVAPGDRADGGELLPVTSIRAPGKNTPSVLLARDPSQVEKESKSYRWLFVIGGLLLLVAFYFTTRSRNADVEERATRGEEDTPRADHSGGVGAAEVEDAELELAGDSGDESRSTDDSSSNDDSAGGKEEKS